MHHSVLRVGRNLGRAVVGRRGHAFRARRPSILRSRCGLSTVGVIVIIVIVVLVLFVIIYFLFGKRDGPRVAYVEIVPPQVVATPESSLLLRVRALDENRKLVNVRGEVASWRAVPAGVAFAHRGLWVEMTLPATTGSYTVFAKIKGKESAPATVTVVPPLVPPATASEDRAIVSTGAGEVPAAVLLDAKDEADGCVSDLLVAVTNEGPIGMNLTIDQNATPTCPIESAVFSQGYAPVLRTDADPVPWTDNAGDVLQQSAASLIQLPVYVWLAVLPIQVTEVSGTADDDIALANALLSENRAGIELVRKTWVLGSLELAGKEVDFPNLYCGSNAETLLGLPNAAGRRLTFDDVSGAAGAAPAVHVIYVRNIAGEDRGFSCLRADGTREDGLVFIGVEGRASTTLVHEIGHLLSLLLPIRYQGHTNLLYGFDQQNLMYGRISLDIAEARDHFSIGQVYRMQFDEDSWLNYRNVRSDPTTRACPCDPYDYSVCPVLSKDVIPRAVGPTNPCSP